MKTTRLLPVPGVPIGYRKDGRPIYPILGGSAAEDVDESDTDEEDEESEEDEDESEDTKSKDGKWAPPSKAEWLKVQAALSKSNASAKQRREALAAATAENQKLRDEQASKDAEAERKALLDAQRPEPDIGRKGKKAAAPPPAGLPADVMTKAQVRQLTQQAAREAEERAEGKFRGIAVNQAARAALSGAGVQSGNVARLVKLLDLDEIQIDDDGEIVEGLDEQIETLKSELPQLFKLPEPEKKPRRAPAPRAQVADRQHVEETPSRTADRMAQQILGTRV